jgi:GT2 family glycosyltransferase
MFDAEGKKSGVDIIVLNCNNAGFIEKCIQSIKANTVGIYNLIVVDNGSTDGSREWLKQKVSHLILNDANLGAGEGRNQGVREAKHDLIVFLDSDVVIDDRDWIDKLWSYTVDKRVGIIEARIRNKDGHIRFAGMSCCMVRKKVFREIGLFDSKFTVGEDIDFWLRFAWHGGYKIEFCDDTNIFHSGGGTAIPEEVRDQNRDRLMFKFSEKIICEYLTPFAERRMAEEGKRGWR